MITIESFLKENNSFKTNLEDSVFRSSFFINSWIGSSNLNNENFLIFLDKLHKKNLDQDPKAEIPKYLLIHLLQSKEIYLIKIEDFLKVNNEIKLNWYNNKIDFYIPRSIWYKSFCLLEKDLPNIFKN